MGAEGEAMLNKLLQGEYRMVRLSSSFFPWQCTYTEKKILIYKEIQMGSVVKEYMRKGFLIYEEMRKYLAISEEDVSHI